MNVAKNPPVNVIDKLFDLIDELDREIPAVALDRHRSHLVNIRDAIVSFRQELFNQEAMVRS
jgi:hypothetical protein